MKKIRRFLTFYVRIKCCRPSQGVVYESETKKVIINGRPVRWTRISLERWKEKTKGRAERIVTKWLKESGEIKCDSISGSLYLCSHVISDIEVSKETIETDDEDEGLFI